MTAIDKKVRRDVIPRWRLSSSVNKLESLPSKKQKRELTLGEQRSVSDVIAEFEGRKRPMIAAEAISMALADGDKEGAKIAAGYLRAMDLSSRPILQGIVSGVLGEGSVGIDKNGGRGDRNFLVQEIGRYKKMLGTYPRSSLAWLDLGFLYSAIGQKSIAEKAVSIAKSIDPNHRTVVRSASRFFVHSGDFDKALRVISDSSSAKIDPWLVSAHIAVSRAAGTTSKLISTGRKMLKGGDFRDDQVSELGAALATNEFEHGNVRLAEKLVRTSLSEPTENAVAQVGWLESIGEVELQDQGVSSRIPNAWEARAFEQFEARNWRQSCEEAALWLTDQPFSSRPAIHGSYVALTFLDDVELALFFSERGYLANPDDLIVANNYVVSLAESSNVSKARSIFDERLEGFARNSNYMLRATEGLLLYREGRLEDARTAYSDARNGFKSFSDARSELLATLYQAKEEMRCNNIEEARHLLVTSMAQLGKLQSADHGAIIERAEHFLSPSGLN